MPRWIKNLYSKLLFRYKSWKFKPPKMRHLMDDKHKRDEFKMPNNLPRTYVASEDVITYSYYLKQLGVEQNLKYGDWYYIRLEDGTCLTKVFAKGLGDEVENWDDFDLYTKEYFRIVSQEEAINLLRSLGFNYSDDDVPIEIDKFGCVRAVFHSEISGLSLSVDSSNTHGAVLKAACIAAMQAKNFYELRPKPLKGKDTHEH